MELSKLKEEYSKKRELIEKRLKDFKAIPQEEYFNELAFCILTPQSNAKKCWTAIEHLKTNNYKKEEIEPCLAKNTRFHKNKTKYLKELIAKWKEIETKLKEAKEENIESIRMWLYENIKGFGLKESAHFLRNIGESYNKIAILDRHILRNLKELGAIDSDKIKNNKHYLQLEEQFKQFSKKLEIPLDHLDLLFWSNETGEIFK